MIRVVSLLLAGALCSSAQTYQPTWESIRKHKVPEWFDDAKLGIFIHWGLFSVPAWAPPSGELGKVDPSQWFKNNPYAEWYLNSIKIKDSPSQQHHLKTYGPNFDYLDFIPTFNREIRKWNPDGWARLFHDTGARYVVLVTKHHDGFTLWPSAVKNPHRKPDQQHADRDIVGDLTTAVRRQGMKMGLYYSGGLDWSFEGDPIENRRDLMARVPQSDEYARYADAHWRELLNRYQPTVLWNDINYPKKGDLLHLFADFYNRVPEGLVNNRWGTDFSDFTTPEYAKQDRVEGKKWEATRGLGFSFGYNQVEGPEQVLPAEKLITTFVDIVSKGGNLLLNIGPKPDGSISQIQLDRLHSLGAWLKANGEAIFDTRTWVRPTGKTVDGMEVRFTRRRDAVYAILLGKPRGREITIESLTVAPGTKVEMLGAGQATWTQSGHDLTLALPENVPVSEAYALKITPRPVVRE
jgi:alpha-L-fucosidase